MMVEEAGGMGARGAKGRHSDQQEGPGAGVQGRSGWDGSITRWPGSAAHTGPG